MYHNPLRSIICFALQRFHDACLTRPAGPPGRILDGAIRLFGMHLFLLGGRRGYRYPGAVIQEATATESVQSEMEHTGAQDTGSVQDQERTGAQDQGSIQDKTHTDAPEHHGGKELRDSTAQTDSLRFQRE